MERAGNDSTGKIADTRDGRDLQPDYLPTYVDMYLSTEPPPHNLPPLPPPLFFSIAAGLLRASRWRRLLSYIASPDHPLADPRLRLLSILEETTRDEGNRGISITRTRATGDAGPDHTLAGNKRAVYAANGCLVTSADSSDFISPFYRPRHSAEGTSVETRGYSASTGLACWNIYIMPRL